MECLNCKKEVEQTKGKRRKLYCSENCRVEFFRKKKAGEGSKRGRGRPRKITLEDQILQNNQPHNKDKILKERNTRHKVKAINPLTMEEMQKEQPFPSNWETMGKIEKLKWLTANK